MRKNLLKNEHLASTVQIVLGCALGALAYPLFLVPNHIAPGGLTGLATVLNYLFHWPVGTTSLLMNIPLFIIGYRAMGRVFVIRSLVATVLFSVLIDLIPLPPMTQQPLLGACLLYTSRCRTQALKIFRLTGGAANAIVSVLRMTRDAPW